MRIKPFIAGLIVLAVLITAFQIVRGHVTAPTSEAAKQAAEAKSFNKKAYSVTDPASLWVIVNKQHPLNPRNYAPKVVVPDVPLAYDRTQGTMEVSTQMAPALKQLYEASKQAGVPLELASGYRSYDSQVAAYTSEVDAYGTAQADAESARPGYSEHQTGLAADLAPVSGKCSVQDCFGDLPEGKWLAANAYKYGFIVRYPADKTNVTGYRHESWHVRYVGTDLSNQLHRLGIKTLEEFFGVSGGPNY